MAFEVRGHARSLIIASCLVALVVLSVLSSAPATSAAGAGDTRLAEAALQRHAPASRALLGQKVDVTARGPDGTPALHWAVRSDDLATVRLLMAAGADPSFAP